MIEHDCKDGRQERRQGVTVSDRRADLIFRTPTALDAAAVFELVKACPPLDANSLYCNLLQCTHFAATCILAERGGEMKGWVSAYRLADDPDTLFVWQVAVQAQARGQGLGGDLLHALLQLPAMSGVARLMTSVTPSNLVSRKMFARFAEQNGWACTIRPWFDSQTHFGGTHESEDVICIGPLSSASSLKSDDPQPETKRKVA